MKSILPIVWLACACGSAPETATIRGVVLSARATGDDVVAGATVTLAGRPPVTTDDAGVFVIEGIAPGPVALTVTGPEDADDVFGTTEIRAQAAAGKTLDVRANLLPACERVFPSETGGEVECGGTRLVFEPGDVAEVDGRPYTGPVRVVVAAADPTVPAQLAALPLDLAADPLAAPAVAGLVEVRLFDALEGRPLQVASGHSVGVTLPVATSASSLTLAVWDGGRWVDEPAGTLSGGAYSFEASHFTIRTVRHPELIWARGIACLTVPVSADVSFAVEGLWIETDIGFLHTSRDPVSGEIQVPAHTTIEKLHASVSVQFPGSVVIYSGEVTIDDIFVPGEACHATPTLPLSRPGQLGCLRGDFDQAHCGGAPGCWVKARRRNGPQVAAARPLCGGGSCSFCLNGTLGEAVDLWLPSGAWFPGEAFAGSPQCGTPAHGACRSVAAQPSFGVEFVRADFTHVVTDAGAEFDVAFDASATMGAISIYEWKIFDADGIALHAATSTGPTFTARLPAAFHRVRLRVVGSAGGTSFTEREISVGGAPSPSFTVTPNPVPVNGTVTFDASATPFAEISRFQWDFHDDGSFDAEGVIATTTYAAAGVHTARLKVTNARNLVGETTRTVQVGGNIAGLTVEIQGQGQVISNDERVVCFATCTVSLPLPYSVTLLASPAPGWTILDWANCDSSNGPACNVTASEPRTVRVRFLPPS